MSIHHHLLTYTNPLQRLARSIAVKIGAINSGRLRVLIYHDIPESEEGAFEAQLRWLMKTWNIISPEKFEAMISGNEPIIGDNLLITFDDGLISNRIVAEKILNPLGIQAVFFVISDFVMIEDHFESRQFIAEHIIPGANITDIPEQWRNMQWSDLEALLAQGHTIGCHTKKHTRLSDCMSVDELEQEMFTSADVIKKRLGNNIDHFAFSFGDIDSFSKAALLVAKQRFSFIYSGVRGNNVKNISPFAIRRDAAAHQLPNNEYKLFDNKLLDAFLGGFADLRYAKPRETLDVWCQ